MKIKFALILGGLFSGLLLFGRAASAQEPHTEPLTVTLYYSQEDPLWPEAEKSLGAALEKFKDKIKFEKVCIDQVEGYARLAKAEKDLSIENAGELTAVVGRFALTSKGAERRDVGKHPGAVLARLLEPGEIKKRREADVLAFARESFGTQDAKAVKTEEKLGVIYYRIQSGEKSIGWVVDVYRAIQCPVCSDAQFLAAISEAPALKVLGLKPVKDLELWGSKLDAEKSAAFLKQFKGREPGQAPKVDAISGATKTSLAYEQALEAVLADLKQRSEKK